MRAQFDIRYPPSRDEQLANDVKITSYRAKQITLFGMIGKGILTPTWSSLSPKDPSAMETKAKLKVKAKPQMTAGKLIRYLIQKYDNMRHDLEPAITVL